MNVELVQGQKAATDADTLNRVFIPVEVYVHGSDWHPLEATVTVHRDNTDYYQLEYYERCGWSSSCFKGRLPDEPIKITFTLEGYDTIVIRMDPRLHQIGSALKIVDTDREPVRNSYTSAPSRSLALQVFMKKSMESWIHTRSGRYPYVPGKFFVYADEGFPPYKRSAFLALTPRLISMLDSLQFQMIGSVCGGWAVYATDSVNALVSTDADSLFVQLQGGLLPQNFKTTPIISNDLKRESPLHGRLAKVVSPSIIVKTTLNEDELRHVVESVGLDWVPSDGHCVYSSTANFWYFKINPGQIGQRVIEALLTHEEIIDAFAMDTYSCMDTRW